MRVCLLQFGGADLALETALTPYDSVTPVLGGASSSVTSVVQAGKKCPAFLLLRVAELTINQQVVLDADGAAQAELPNALLRKEPNLLQASDYSKETFRRLRKFETAARSPANVWPS